MNLRTLCIVPAFALLGLTAQFGCNSSGPGQPNIPADYELRVTLIQDPNVDSSRTIAKLFKEGADYDGAQLQFGNNLLNFYNTKYGFDTIFAFSQNMTPGYAAGPRSFFLDDSPFYQDTIVITICSSFVITDINVPASRIVRSTPPDNRVTYTWSGSANAQNYVMAAVLADSAYRSYGYSTYLVSGTPSGTLPPEAFSVSPNPDLDTGLYNIYVYAINGSPDSAMTDGLLPVPLPSQRPNNISSPDLIGRFGSIQITLIDTVRAQTSK